MLAIIGGSGLTQLASLAISRRQVVRTPYGDPSSALIFGAMAGRDVVFLARHGQGHTIPPHRVNYRANLWALQSEGVSEIVAVFSVGGIASALSPGVIAVPAQLIDYTHGRAHTYFDGHDLNVVHIDFTQPYTRSVRLALLDAARQAGVPSEDGGVYAAVNGPRLETAAEIDRMEKDGATMVGMTGMPEAGLARELGLKYAALAVSVNHAAGRGDSVEQISLEQLRNVLDPAMIHVRQILESWVHCHD
ncbi:MAG: S-methyl-5'-thioinosine phosphorylase [Betaproteobacteria bacterium]